MRTKPHADDEEDDEEGQTPKRPLGRQPAGAVLVDGKWQMSELSIQLAAERLLRQREARCTRWRAKQDLLRSSHPELFATRGLDPRQTTLTPERSKERNADLLPYQKSDTSSTTSDIFDASLFWRSLQRDNGTPSLSRGSASL